MWVITRQIVSIVSVTHLEQAPVGFRAAIREVVHARLGQWVSDSNGSRPKKKAVSPWRSG